MEIFRLNKNACYELAGILLFQAFSEQLACYAEGSLASM
jgi:hypothetical protein